MGMYIERQIRNSRVLAAFLLTNHATAIAKAESALEQAGTQARRDELTALLDRLRRSERTLEEHPELLGPAGAGPFGRLAPVPELVLRAYADYANEATKADGGSELAPGGTRRAWPSHAVVAAITGRDRTVVVKAVRTLKAAGVLIDTGEVVNDVVVLKVADLVPAWEQALDAAGVLLIDRDGEVRTPVLPAPAAAPAPVKHKHTDWVRERGELLEWDDAAEYNEAIAVKRDWNGGHQATRRADWLETVRTAVAGGWARPVPHETVTLPDRSTWVLPAKEASALGAVAVHLQRSTVDAWVKRNRAHAVGATREEQRSGGMTMADAVAMQTASDGERDADDNGPAVPMPPEFRAQWGRPNWTPPTYDPVTQPF